MHLGDLAFELQLQVLKLCSRGDLASLCRTHTPMRDVADYALYSHIPGPFHSSSCQDSSFLETLATNDHKASLVRVLDVQLTLGTHDLRGRFLKLIAKMLPSMLNLYELRIAVHNRGFEDTEIPLIQWMSEISVEINQAIRGGYFLLRLLCLEDSQCHWEDIKRIVASQPDLRLLGFYRRNKNFKSLPTIAQKLHYDPSRLHPMPTIFILDFYEDNNRIILQLLPSHHRPGEALAVFTEIEACFNSFLQNTYTLSLNLFGISKENIGLLREAMEAVATCKQPRSFLGLNIVVHQTSIQNPWQFPEFVKPLALFSHLETLTFRFRYVVGETKLRALSTDMRSYLVNANLEILCPNLRNIQLQCKWNPDLRKLLHHRPQWLPETH